MIEGNGLDSMKPYSVIRIAYLYDLLVRHTGEEYMLFVLIWMETDNVRDLPIAEAFEALSGLRVPEFHLTVVAAR